MGLFGRLERARSVRQKEKTLPTLLLPLTRGPIQGFYHFFLGYFVPAYWEHLKNPNERFVLMSIPSFDHWFELLPGERPKLIDQAKVAKHAFLANRRGFSSHYKVKGLDYWDKWQRFSERPLAEIAERMRSDLTERFHAANIVKSDVLVLGRSPIRRFPGEEFTRPSGDLARSIPNLPDVRSALAEEFTTEFLDGSVMSTKEAFLKCHGARLILGQHGAAFSNILFAGPQTGITEIIWPELEQRAQLTIYSNLCDALGLRWSRPVLQRDSHSAVNPKRVVEEVRKILATR